MRAPSLLRASLLPLLALLSLLPLALLLVRSLGGSWFWPALLPPQLDAEPWRRLLAAGGGGRLARAAASSVLLAVGTGVLASVLALPCGRALAALRGWPARLGAAAAFLPVAAPPIAVAVGLQYSFLRLGLGGTAGGVLIAHLIPALGYTTLFFLGVFHDWDARLEDEARTLGASPRQVLLRVTLPLLRGPLLEAFVLGFLVSWAQVPLTLLIGQGLVRTLATEVLVYVQAGQDGLAATGALLLVLPGLLTLAAARIALRRADAAPV